jgi:hypothetical protein
MKEIGLLLAMLPLSALAFSQAPIKAQTNHPHSSVPTETITLSNSAVALTGPWKFQPGRLAL